MAALPVHISRRRFAEFGDWECPRCGDLQFARNDACRKCGASRNSRSLVEESPAAAIARAALGFTDWVCPTCGDLQFRRNVQCRRCGGARPHEAELAQDLRASAGRVAAAVAGVGHAAAIAAAAASSAPTQLALEPASSSRSSSRTDSVVAVGATAAPKLAPGDWQCAKCGDAHFAQSVCCRRCNTPRPEDAEATPAPAMVSRLARRRKSADEEEEDAIKEAKAAKEAVAAKEAAAAKKAADAAAKRAAAAKGAKEAREEKRAAEAPRGKRRRLQDEQDTAPTDAPSENGKVSKAAGTTAAAAAGAFLAALDAGASNAEAPDLGKLGTYDAVDPKLLDNMFLSLEAEVKDPRDEAVLVGEEGQEAEEAGVEEERPDSAPDGASEGLECRKVWLDNIFSGYSASLANDEEETTRRFMSARPRAQVRAAETPGSRSLGAGGGLAAPSAGRGPALGERLQGAVAYEREWECLVCGESQYSATTSCSRCSSPREGGPATLAFEFPLFGAPCGEARSTPSGCVIPPPRRRPGAAAETTASAGTNGGGGAGGEWSCPRCGDYQFAHRRTCRKCGELAHWASASAPDVRADSRGACAGAETCGAGACGAGAQVNQGVCGGGREAASQFPNAAEAVQMAMVRAAELQQAHKEAAEQEAAQQMAAQQEAAQQAAAAAEAAQLAGDWICSSCSAMMTGNMSHCQLCGSQCASGAETAAVALSKVMVEHTAQQRSVRVDNIPEKMSGENLLMILSGMFGKTRRVQFGLHPGTEDLFATVEFESFEAASKATTTAHISFGQCRLDILPNP